MALVTRCPSCNSTFRVTSPQLQARGGEVRCGKCAQVFDGFATLTTVEIPETADLFEAQESESLALRFPFTTVPAQPVPFFDPAVAEFNAPSAASPLIADSPSQRAAQIDFVPQSGSFAPPAKTSSSPLWLFGSALLLVTLAGQWAFFMRTELANSVPASKPYLEQFCERAGCTVPLARDVDHLIISASALEADPQQVGVITLVAAVRNRAAYQMAHPAIELTLTDAQDEALVRRSFAAAEYLPAPKDTAQGILPNQEINVRVRFDSGDLRAAGYRLFLFYP